MIGDALVGAVAQELVKELSKAIQSQAQYAIQFDSQFKELREQLELMQSFVADSEKVKKDMKTVKILVSGLQELIDEADDLVVDCQIRADHQKMKGSSCYPSLPSKMFFRYETGKKLAKINKEIKSKRENLMAYYVPIVGGARDLHSESKRPWSSDVFDQSEIVGLTNDAATIKKWILSQDDPQLRIGIVGMGGLGKTTLSKVIFRDESLSKRFQKKIWISVSRCPDELDIMRSMLKQLDVNDTGSSKGDLLSRISKLLSDKTYLIVLDDVWKSDWWESISSGLPKTKGHSNCIIITSRNKTEVRKLGVKKTNIHEPKLLGPEESWELFCRVVSSRRDEPMASDDTSVEAAKELVKKCGGLPLAIKAIAGLLSLKDHNDWDRIRNNFHEKLSAAEGESTDGCHSVIASLRLSYDELPGRLKQCLLCFSIYPEDHEIDAEQLVRWWEGEGFVHGKSKETARESAFNCLSELISRCLVEVARRRNFDGSIYTCKMHDMVREMVIGIAKEEDFCSFDDEGRHIANPSSRRLGVTNDTLLQPLQGNMKLRALLLTKKCCFGFKKKIALATVKSLRVLDLSNATLDSTSFSLKDFWTWITSLKRLAYMNLRGIEMLIQMPESIKELWGLQVLIVEECQNLQKLPAAITSLPRLRILDVGNCPKLRFLPEGFSRLLGLQELYGFKIAGQGSRFADLQALTKLRVLQIDISEESIIQDHELTALKEHTELRVLSIDAGDCEGKDILRKLENFTPPMSIEELYLKHYFGETAPGWINPTKLPKLLFLCIEDSRVKEMSKNFWEHNDHKWNVRGLCLKFCQRLELKTWEELQILMPEMKHLDISQCNSLDQSFPCDVKASGFWYKEEKKKKNWKFEETFSQAK